uniref:Retroviral polymerase SH3-like domain-containing protein n=1 Tax=Tanacetum cinerariifolium TaxID=118510 RepID=A0A699HXH9_TANCI|nr:hypothetical protein [Tanacetum cinerariifolium]
MIRSMMSQTTLPKSFWDYALETAARILNMVPTKKVDKTPYEIWYGQAPKLCYLKVWGYEAFVKRDTLTKPDKLDPRSFKCIFVGYPKKTMGYSFYSPSENKIFVAQNAKFFESKLLDLKANGSVKDLELIQEEDTNPSVDTAKIIKKMIKKLMNLKEHELGDLGEPANYKAALLDPESKKWLDAMNVEMQSMKDNDTGYVFVLNGGAVDWKSTKQSIFATSSIDAEYIAAFDASKEAVWIRKFISGLGIVPTIKELISMYCDNTGAIAIAKDNGITKAARHFRAKVHYLRETITLDDYLIRKQFGIQEFLRETKTHWTNSIDWYRQQVHPHALAAHAAWVKGQKKELKAMYSKQAEQELLQTVREFHTSKQEEGKGNMGHASNNAPFSPKPKTPPPPKKGNPAKDAIFHQCGEVGHWRRNCLVYLAELMKRRSYLRELALKGLRGSKKLKPGALSLYVGDGHRAAVEAIGTYHLELPSGLVIVLNNFHYAPFITRGVILVLCLFFR